MRAFEQRKKESPARISFFSSKIQKKIKTGEAGNKFEVEADKVADRVVNKTNNNSNGLLQAKEEDVQKRPISKDITPLQKKEMKEEEPVQKKEEKEEEKKVQKKSDKEEKSVQAKLRESNSVNEGVESDLNSSKGSGSAMDKNTKKEMETGFGADFSSVHIHTDSKAVQMSEQLGAQAFTHGNDVYFNKGKYNPNSKEGKHLLAHELTHTIQQTGSKTQNSVQKLSDPDCSATKHLKLSGSCYDYHNTCYTETFVPSKSDALKIVIDVDYMEPVGSWIKEDFSAQVIKCGLIDDTNIGSERISPDNIPSTLEFSIASVTPGDKYFIRIYSRSSSALKSNYTVSQ